MLKLKFRRQKRAREPDGTFLGKHGFDTGESGVAFHFPPQSMTLTGLPVGLGLPGHQRDGRATKCLLRTQILSQRDSIHLFRNSGESDLIAPSRTLTMKRKVLSPLPGLERLVADVTDSWRYGLLSDAAPQFRGLKFHCFPPISTNLPLSFLKNYLKRYRLRPASSGYVRPFIFVEKTRLNQHNQPPMNSLRQTKDHEMKGDVFSWRPVMRMLTGVRHGLRLTRQRTQPRSGRKTD